MTNILENESIHLRARLDIAKVMLDIQNQEIQQLKNKLSQIKTESDWVQDQSSYHRMEM